ncbi:MAG: hypothetical protein KAI53_01415 [Candidatus Aenigmarchaeota archaeon]|nr:hypothetical protein [Candidatus Aenigmarchaeota archaeon]
MYTKVSKILGMQEYSEAKKALELNLHEAVFNKSTYRKYVFCKTRIDVLRYIITSFDDRVPGESLVDVDKIIQAFNGDEPRKYYGTLIGNLKNKLPGIIGVSNEKTNGNKNKVNSYYLKKDFINRFDEKFKTDGGETLLELLALLEVECPSESS